jgi:hypothetical protein
MPIDLWTVIDILSSFMNVVAFNVIGSLTPEKIVGEAYWVGRDRKI